MATRTVAVETDRIELACDACDTKGIATRETGDVMDRVGAFARCHLAPRVVRAHFVTPLGGDIGWYDWTSPCV